MTNAILAILTGLSGEADLLGPIGHITNGALVLCGSAQRDSLARLVPSSAVRGLVSFGVAGALAPDLGVGDLVIATSVTLPDGTLYQSNIAWASEIALKTGAKLRPFFSARTEQAATAEQRAALHATMRVDVVDQETLAIAQLAKARSLPWIAVRTISDLSTENLPSMTARATNPDGSPNLMVVLEGLADPEQGPAIAASAKNYEAALASLRNAWGILKPRFMLP